MLTGSLHVVLSQRPTASKSSHLSQDKSMIGTDKKETKEHSAGAKEYPTAIHISHGP